METGKMQVFLRHDVGRSGIFGYPESLCAAGYSTSLCRDYEIFRHFGGEKVAQGKGRGGEGAETMAK